MKNYLLNKSLLGLLVAAPFFVSCDDDGAGPVPDESNEQITTVRYVLTPATGGASITVEYRDLDGDGGTAPTIGTLMLASNTTYNGRLTFIDETQSPVEDITDEIEDEDEEHLIVFTPTGTNVTVTVTDRDNNNLPVGLQTQIVTGAANALGIIGGLRVVLRHQPDAKDGTATPGDTDVDVNFPTTVR